MLGHAQGGNRAHVVRDKDEVWGWEVGWHTARAKMKEVQERQPLVKAAQLAAYAHITDRLKPVHFRACGGNGGWGGHG